MRNGANPITTLAGALRVYQWPKNLLVFGALVFSQELTDIGQLLRSIAAFAVMCAASSAVYILNDLNDVEKDRAHPEKCRRPFASGTLSVATGIVMMIGLAIGALAAAFLIHVQFAAVVLIYMVLNVFYSTLLKNIPIIDVMIVALGFVLRAIAGAMAIDVVFSNWLVVCTLFLALFLALGKRRRELLALEDGGSSHREVLAHYSVPFLEQLILIMATCTLIVYVSYVCSPEVTKRFGTDKLYFTIPFVVYGLFRYIYLVHHRQGGGDPSKTLLTDGPLLAAVVMWGLTSMYFIYAGTAWM